MLLKFFLNLDIINLTWEHGLINSFSSWKMISRWVLFYHGQTSWMAPSLEIKNISLTIVLLIFKYIKCIFKIFIFFYFFIFSNEKIFKSESFRSHDKLYLHIKICKQDLYGETPPALQLPAGQLVICKQWLRAGLKFYNNFFLIIMVKFQEKVCYRKLKHRTQCHIGCVRLKLELKN